MSGVLEISGLSVHYGGVVALQDASLAVEPGGITGLIGPNGAGKTTMLGACAGFVPAKGSVRLEGRELVGTAPHRIASAGLVRTFQGVRAVNGLTVRENVLAGNHRMGRSGALGALLGGPRARSEERRAVATAEAALERVGLADLADRFPSDLSTGRLRLLEIARTLAADPRVLLLDEPAAGLNAEETTRLEGLLRTLGADGVGCVLVEHDVELVLRVCDRVSVLDQGRVIAAGLPAEVRRDRAVVEAYLGPRRDREEALGA